MNGQKLNSVFQSLRSEFNEMPPASLELALRAELRNVRMRRRARRSLSIAVVAAALLLLIGRPVHKTNPPVRQSPPPRTTIYSKAASDRPADFVQTRKALHSRVRARLRQPRVSDPNADFIAIPYTGSLSASQRLDVYRVQMPRAMVVQFGLPMNASSFDSVATADVVVGEDGVARAIRFVR